MANTWYNNTEVKDMAELALADEAIIPYVTTRNIEEEFAAKNGQTVYAKLPPTVSASNFVDGTDTLSASDVTQTRVPIKLEKHFAVRMDVNSLEDLVNLDSFASNILIPGIQGVVSAIESYGISRLSGGFAAGGIAGTAGTEVSTIAQMFAGEKVIFDNQGDVSNLKSVVTSTSYSSLAQLSTNISLDNTPNGPANLAGNMVGPVANVDQIIRSRNAGSQSFLTLAGTVVTNGTGSAGDRVSIVLDGITNDDGDIVPAGQTFTIADSTGTFVVMEDATVASNAVTLVVNAPGAWTDGKAYTVATAYKQNTIFNPAGVACAILPGMEGNNTMIIRARDAQGRDAGFGIRMIESDVSESSLAKSFVFDAFCGVKVVRPEYGCIVN